MIFDIILIGIGSLLGVLILAAAGYVFNNLNYYKAPLRATFKAGYAEKQATLEDGDQLNYAEGPRSGPALFLIHGQCVSWEDYANVLPELAQHYHVFAVDCHGHGKSSRNPEKYSANAMGKDFVWFIENVIGEPAVVSGHSSGGLLTAWLAANSPENVRGIVLEDPPFFSCEPARAEKSFAWVDSFTTAHSFLQQGEEKDYPLYYLRHSRWLTFFGKGRDGILKYAAAYRAKHPNQRLEIFFLPSSINRMFWSMDSYDPRFGDTFYGGAWHQAFDHAETLAKIKCPSVLIHASWRFDENGLLLAAMSGDDAERAHALIKDNALIDVASGHDVHSGKPKQFSRIMVDLLQLLQ
nr:hypothetical protein [uncultured bacterium]QCO92816.1 hypothetical protein [uncultured bacterium]QCO92868.1 hypothetical protein [uncultured bacterium]QCO92901.1 hypothetical protein [uncultured bacterium]QCO92935.1 hypothetical protein [uncultured bacterium]